MAGVLLHDSLQGNQFLTSFSPFTSDFFQKEMSRMFPWKVTFLRHHYQLASGECTFKRAVIRRRRRGLPVRGFQGSAVASETSSESRLALSVFNCIVSSEQSLSFSESAKSFGGEKTFCFGNIWRFLLFPFYLPFDSKMCFPDTITRSEVKMKNID